MKAHGNNPDDPDLPRDLRTIISYAWGAHMDEVEEFHVYLARVLSLAAEVAEGALIGEIKCGPDLPNMTAK